MKDRNVRAQWLIALYSYALLSLSVGLLVVLLVLVAR